MNVDALNRYVVAAIGLFAVFSYVAIIFMGIAELISRMPKRSTRRKRSRDGSTARRLRNAKKSV